MKNQEKKQPLSKKAGDAIERVGQKIGGKFGKRIYDAGDKLEHSQDEKTVKGSNKRPIP